MEGPKIRLSLEPLELSRWEMHEATGAQFLIAPLDAARDQDLTRQCHREDGTLDSVAFARLVAVDCVKDWKGVGDKGVAVPFNQDNLTRFMKYHAITIGPWIIRRSRSMDHFLIEEKTAAKNA